MRIHPIQLSFVSFHVHSHLAGVREQKRHHWSAGTLNSVADDQLKLVFAAETASSAFSYCATDHKELIVESRLDMTIML